MAYSRIRFEIQNSATMTLVHSATGLDLEGSAADYGGLRFDLDH